MARRGEVLDPSPTVEHQEVPTPPQSLRNPMTLPSARLRSFAHAAAYLLLLLPSGRALDAAEPEPTFPVTGAADARLASFDRMMTRFVAENKLPGAALAVARNGRVVYARGFGHADAEGREPVRPRSLFRIASVSKPITLGRRLAARRAGQARAGRPRVRPPRPPPQRCAGRAGRPPAEARHRPPPAPAPGGLGPATRRSTRCSARSGSPASSARRPRPAPG